MLVICEECAKKYVIDETRIKQEKVYFYCKKCNHRIILKKIEDEKIILEEVDESENVTD